MPKLYDLFSGSDMHQVTFVRRVLALGPNDDGARHVSRSMAAMNAGRRHLQNATCTKLLPLSGDSHALSLRA